MALIPETSERQSGLGCEDPLPHDRDKTDWQHSERRNRHLCRKKTHESQKRQRGQPKRMQDAFLKLHSLGAHSPGGPVVGARQPSSGGFATNTTTHGWCVTSPVEFYCWAVITRKEEENILLLVKGQLHFCTTSLSFAGSALSSRSLLTFSNVVFPVLSSTGRWSESEEIIYFPH